MYSKDDYMFYLYRKKVFSIYRRLHSITASGQWKKITPNSQVSKQLSFII